MIPERLRRIQKKIHGTLEAQVDRLLGPLPEAIRRYERNYRKDFPTHLLERAIQEAREADPRESERLLIESIRATPVTVVGDYHTYAQAQRTALRLLREAYRPGENWWLGVELLSSAQQQNLDAFQRGELSVPEFHARIGYDREWGFPWTHYEPLFQWARENGVRVIALNRPRPFLSLNPRVRSELSGDRDLFDRDQWAAGIVTDLFAEAYSLGFENPRMMILYGELHLGSRHLPHQIREVSRSYFNVLGKSGLPENLQTLVLHQNYDPLYWRLAQKGLAEGHPLVQLSTRTYCIFSGTPWGKLQSLVSWAEAAGTVPVGPEHDLRASTPLSHQQAVRQLGRSAPADDEQAELEDESEFEDENDEEDLLGEISLLSRTIAEGFEVSVPDLSSLHLCTASDPEYITRAIQPPRISKNEAALARALLRLNIRFHLPAESVVFLGTPSPNGMAEMAALLTLRSRTLSPALFDPSFEGTARHALECAGAFLGAWFLNPRRKCDLRQDHLARARLLRKQSDRTQRPLFPGELEARELAAHLSQATGVTSIERELARWSSWSSEKKRSTLSLFLAFRFFGQELGYRAGKAIVRQESAGHRIRHLLLARMDGRGRALAERLDELLRMLPPDPSQKAKPRVV
jgi:hypothetical protein